MATNNPLMQTHLAQIVQGLCTDPDVLSGKINPKRAAANAVTAYREFTLLWEEEFGQLASNSNGPTGGTARRGRPVGAGTR